MPAPHVVIIGGGFGGLSVARGLAREPVRITLIDRRNHHLFQPLLYQVATAALAPSDIAEPLRGILGHQKNAEVLKAEVTGIDPAARTVTTLGGRVLAYDTLVVAAGAVSSYFGHDDWEDHAPGLKTIGDALDIRHRTLDCFERAEWADSDAERRRLLSFVVIGGGPTGVEMAGALQEIACQMLARDFRHIDASSVSVTLVEGQDLLTPFPDALRKKARAQLEGLGVHVHLGEMVEEVGADFVQVGGRRIEAGTIIWAAGVRAAPVADTLGGPQDRGGRIEVAPDLTLPGHPNVFVIGDMAHVVADGGGSVPGVAPAAMQMGRFVAACIRADRTGAPRGTFRYTNKGNLATIGRSRAVADLPGGIRMSGFPAWVLWVFVHLMTLVGHRNRLVVFLKWALAWVTLDRSSRLLWRDEQALLQGEEAARHAQHAAERLARRAPDALKTPAP